MKPINEGYVKSNQKDGIPPSRPVQNPPGNSVGSNELEIAYLKETQVKLQKCILAIMTEEQLDLYPKGLGMSVREFLGTLPCQKGCR